MDNETSKKVRIHKHNYAGEFGNVVVDPIISVLEELIKNPQLFEEEEKQRILKGLRMALYSHGAYDLLGYDISEQLSQIQSKIVPAIKENCDLLGSIWSKNREYNNQFLPEILEWAISHTQSLSFKLLNIQNDDKGIPQKFSLLEFVEQLFCDDKIVRSRKGLRTFDYDIFGRSLSDIQVLLDREGFKMNVINNIIDNIHKYAFPEKTHISIKKKGWFLKIIDCFRKHFWSKQDIINIEERKVQISLKTSPDDSNQITLVIENNGIPFEGDIASIFKYGYHIGEGSGIGMYSASKFLQENGGSISMECTPEKEYKVRFIIKLPIYGKIQNSLVG